MLIESDEVATQVGATEDDDYNMVLPNATMGKVEGCLLVGALEDSFGGSRP